MSYIIKHIQVGKKGCKQHVKSVHAKIPGIFKNCYEQTDIVRFVYFLPSAEESLQLYSVISKLYGAFTLAKTFPRSLHLYENCISIIIYKKSYLQSYKHDLTF